MSGNTRTVYYQLTKEAAVPGWSDTEEAVGRWFKSRIYTDESGRVKDYSYPHALQKDGSWMMCGRVVSDFSKIKLYDQMPKQWSNSMPKRKSKAKTNPPIPYSIAMSIGVVILVFTVLLPALAQMKASQSSPGTTDTPQEVIE